MHIFNILGKLENWKIIFKFEDKKMRFKRLSGVNPSFLGYYLGAEKVPDLDGYTLIALFPNQESAKDFLSVYKAFSQNRASFYPALGIPPFAEVFTLNEEERERLKVLWELPTLKVIALEIKSFLRRTISREQLKLNYLYLLPGEKIDRETLIEDIVRLGYERVGVVRSKGEFTSKGAVLDLFSPQNDYPTRIEFFGDEVISLKAFDPETQRRLGYLEELSILPARELFFPKDSQPLYEKILSYKDKLSEKRISELLQMVENKIILENPDFLLPLLWEDLKLLPENLGEKICFVLFEREKLLKEMEVFWDRIYNSAKKAKEKERLLVAEEKLYATIEEVTAFFDRYPTLEAFELPLADRDTLLFPLQKYEISREASRLEQAFNFLKEHLSAGREIFLFVQDEKNSRAILDGLRYRGIEDFDHLSILTGDLQDGFFFPDKGLVLTSDFELFGKRIFKKEEKQALKRVRGYFRKFEDLKPGDYVVHKLHGIGRFQGLISLKVDGFEGEFLQIEYEGGDKLYVPVTKLEELYPYVGVEEKIPQLDKLGKKTFLKKRKEVEKKLTEVVEEILRLYAERRTLKGFSIPVDNLSYAEFSQTFPYEETPDQLSAIEEVLEDLQSSKPMERLVVGDVGFGKTEVALRAIFVTARAGKQVACLTPTTLLAEQHYRNFKERLDSFGIKVGILSRLRSEGEQRAVLKALQEGEIQVVVGTHRLLSKDVQFKDLGLLVIDEEHRFGVRQKERLKQLKKAVKVLSLSATPIPRSLQLSLLGIFDLSLIETPPLGRKSIKTFLTPFDPEVIKAGLEEELSRGGQVYFVHPRIQGLTSLAKFLEKLMPSAHIEIVHGQMDSSQLERAIFNFLERKVDILVCTPIIGSGIDIPSANTIFINRADMFGLADIYQLRGRVGRGQETAYCYLLVPDLKGLTENAQKRLKALMKFVELGSGFKLSLSDLKIRGAGELLGINQSGHINKVGYELYLELLENTIRSLKGEEIEDWEPEVNIKVPAFIPSKYVPETEERLSLYRELVLIKSFSALEDFMDFLKDKYGALPKEAENLIKIYQLKLYMKSLKILSIEEKGRNLLFYIKDLYLLPKFRKASQNESYQLLKVKDEKERAILIYKVDGPFLDSALKICQTIKQ
ncbi:transcription-repair coupling factor [Caldimicrobium thiodismutans]|uniref:Transcription-repair-coupling factor n=1 Tax=Caldimicrobium thiodismutans TaxID=1653476 RepID=A0A0U5APN6_9BACT|nr:transcription-repair coupling factor [Caldimicrobium thiodismutans]BAU22801.1 transcription-repair coupling factor [Caldimicrobium thiodismutans]